MEFSHEGLKHPMDFSIDEEVTLQGLQLQVRNRQMRPTQANQYMNAVWGAPYYDTFSEELPNGKVAIDGVEG